MFKIANYQLFVQDQDEALAFYTQKLQMEVRSDVTVPELGNFRWLTVGPRDQPEISLVLMAVPGEPMLDKETSAQLRALMDKGVGSAVFLTTDDCQAAYEELSARGVEFQEKPEDRLYGIDAGFRDPFGNVFRLTQLKDQWEQGR
ncbi:VOC family protein [Actinospica durhamensis]|uniref:VOC family protein n=1 Tax=Actinospica durhamensis TaxID=1508375 RepID=A0A941ITW8_9ACTN|nr:VOC family protein [Actinospica durhamensis]MBR7836548.1 VOC family protein [Actinospica durhamensis]